MAVSDMEPAWDLRPLNLDTLVEQLDVRLFPRFLDHIVSLPAGWVMTTGQVPAAVTEEGWRRYQHEDLAGLGLPALYAERERVRLRLLLDPTPPGWLFERFERVEACISTRTPGHTDANA